MKNSLLLLILLFGTAGSLMAQARGAYQFDNFDIANGVRIQQPVENEALKSMRGKGTRNWTPGAGPAAPGILTTLTSMSVGRSLDGFTTGNAEVDSFIVNAGTHHGVDPV
ncbi:MAG: hypothetical protein M3R68_07075, partial [Acidobacteriota bacterium]|nr:hypothetical protein [Acidobacteriota bacterium]